MLTSAGRVKIIECPRDAMQGLQEFIPTAKKIQYLNTLLRVGFDTLDFGSFVSHAAVPQMRDTAEIIGSLDLHNTSTNLLAIVANQKGAEQAFLYPQITYLGFPLSLSETFQKRNTNRTIAEAFRIVEEIQNQCIVHNKELVIYLSMGFGNPYGDDFNEGYLLEFTKRLSELGIGIVCPSDTSGQANEESIKFVFSTLIQAYPHIEFGAHLHSNPATAIKKFKAAYLAGCRRFDGAIKGFGGCPMADDHLVGNIATENMLAEFTMSKIYTGVDAAAFNKALDAASQLFPAL